MWGLIVTLLIVLGLLFYVGSWVWASYRQEQEGRSETVVGVTRYDLGASTAEASAYEEARSSLLKEIFRKDDVPAVQLATAFKTTIPDSDRKRLKALLIRRMISCIDPIRKLRNDKQGLLALAGKKLVSEQYVRDYFESEHMMNSEMEYIMGESEILEEGWSSKIFTQALTLWKHEMQKKTEALIKNQAASIMSDSAKQK